MFCKRVRGQLFRGLIISSFLYKIALLFCWRHGKQWIPSPFVFNRAIGGKETGLSIVPRFSFFASLQAFLLNSTAHPDLRIIRLRALHLSFRFHSPSECSTSEATVIDRLHMDCEYLCPWSSLRELADIFLNYSSRAIWARHDLLHLDLSSQLSVSVGNSPARLPARSHPARRSRP